MPNCWSRSTTLRKSAACTPGLALVQARAMHPLRRRVPEDAEADATLLENIADWCLRYTPLIACDAPDGLLLDITGCTHLYGGERQLIADLAGRLETRRFCLSYRQYSPAPSARPGLRRITRRARGGELHQWRRAENLVPVAARRIKRLARRGGSGPSHHWRALASSASATSSICRAAPLTARFGAELLRQLDRALGRQA